MLAFTEMIRRYSEEYRSKMKSLTSILLDKFGINYFHFHQVKNDGRLFFISNCIEYNEFFFSQPEIRSSNPYTISPKFIKEGIYDSELQDYQGSRKAVNYFKDLINVDRSFTIFHKVKDGYIIGCFGFSNINSARASLFINNINAINDYLAYFTDEISPVLKKSGDNAIDLNAVMGANFHAPTYFMCDGRDIIQSYYKRLNSGTDSSLSVPEFTERKRERMSQILY